MAARSWCSAIAVPSSNGWAMIASGRTHWSPSASRSSSRIAGEATVIRIEPGAVVVDEPGEGRLHARRRSSGRRGMLEHHHVKSGRGEVDRADQAGGPGSDHGNTLIAGHRAARITRKARA